MLFFSCETVTAQGGFGMRFCCHVEIWLAYTCIAVQGGWLLGVDPGAGA